MYVCIYIYILRYEELNKSCVSVSRSRISSSARGVAFKTEKALLWINNNKYSAIAKKW